MDGYDLHTKVQMHIGNTLVTLETAINQPEKKEVLMKGTKGEIRIQDLHRPTSAELKTEDKVEIIDCPYEIDDFYGEISHFVNLLQSGEKNSSIMSIQTSLETAMLLDRIKDAMTPNPIEIIIGKEKHETGRIFASICTKSLTMKVILLMDM